MHACTNVSTVQYHYLRVLFIVQKYYIIHVHVQCSSFGYAIYCTCTCINTIIFILHTMVIFNGYLGVGKFHILAI